MNKIPVSGVISPIYSTDNYPVIDPLLGIDGLRSVNSLSDMYSIPIEKRRSGMVVGVVNTMSSSVDYYTLLPFTWSLNNTYNEWTSLFAGLSGPSSLPLKSTLQNEIVLVPNKYQYLVYGDLTLDSGSTMSNSGKVVIINGTLTYSNTLSTITGSYTGTPPVIINLSPLLKYSLTFSVQPSQYFTVSHYLNTQDITFNIRDGMNFIYPNITILDNNNVLLYTTGTISNGRINIIG